MELNWYNSEEGKRLQLFAFSEIVQGWGLVEIEFQRFNSKYLGVSIIIGKSIKRNENIEITYEWR